MGSSVHSRRPLINIDLINVDDIMAVGHDRGVSTMVRAGEAARVLGVTKATLYAYVSRGLVERTTAVDGRTSLYRRDQLEQLARERSGRRRPIERPSIDVQIGSAVTTLADDAVRYRGHDTAGLARSHGFESVAELLWTGAIPAVAPSWPIDRAALARCLAAIDAAGCTDPTLRLAIAAATLAPSGAISDHPLDPRHSVDALPGAAWARRLLALAPTVLGGPRRGGLASRLTKSWVGRPAPEIVDAVDHALVLLADHELATSTLGVRVAASVRSHPADAIATGLHILRSPLHGSATRAAAGMLAEAEVDGPAVAIARRLDAGRRLPGFGHTVYRRGDPRVAPLLDAVRAIPGAADRIAAVDGVIAEAGPRVGHLPNVDLALGALTVVAGFPHDAALFAVARIAGWAAHYDEEIAERPVRYRGLATLR